MDVIAFNILGDLPPITRYWTLGCATVMVLTSLNLIDSTKLIYNYDLVFHKKQYHRILLSVFDYGNLTWSTIGNVLITVNQLSYLERSFNDRRRFAWFNIFLLAIIIFMTKFSQPFSSLGMLLHENLVNFQFKKNSRLINLNGNGMFDMITPLFPLFSYASMYAFQGRSFFQISINFLPAHIIFYFDDVVGKLYGVDLVKPPNELWNDFQNWRGHSDTPEVIDNHPPTEDPLDTPNMIPVEENVEEINEMQL